MGKKKKSKRKVSTNELEVRTAGESASSEALEQQANRDGEETSSEAQRPPMGLRDRWRKANEKRAFRWGTQLAFFLLIFWAIMAFQTRNLINSDEPAPAFELPDRQGEPTALADFEGQKVVLVFWSPFCSVCAAEVGNLNAVNENEDVQVLSIVLSYKNLEEVDAFIRENEVEYPVLLGDRSIASSYKVESYPTIYIVDEAGQIDSSMVGYTTEMGLEARLLF